MILKDRKTYQMIIPWSWQRWPLDLLRMTDIGNRVVTRNGSKPRSERFRQNKWNLWSFWFSSWKKRFLCEYVIKYSVHVPFTFDCCKIKYKTRMHSSRMRTARSLIVSPYLVVFHACPPSSPCTPPSPCMPPFSTYPTSLRHTCPPATTHTPSNRACPLATTYPLATMHAPQQPCTPPSNHTCPPRQPCMPPKKPCMPPWQPCMPPGNHTCPHPPVDRQTPVKS